MASRTLHSSQINFIDLTDSRRLDVYIASNLPNSQIKNSNTDEYTPDWSVTPLVLSASVFIDGTQLSAGVAFQWYQKTNLSIYEEAIENATTASLTISTNVLSDIDIVAYICKATYQGIVSQSQVTFNKVLTGKNGDPGTSFSIKGTAASVAPIEGTDYYTITYGAGVITTAQLGDAYLYGDYLYVCADSRDGEDYFINVGNVRGPAGQDAKSIVLTASTQIFKINKSNVSSPTNIHVTGTAFNTTISQWLYSINGGSSFSVTPPSGVSRSGNIVTISSSIEYNSLAIKATDGTYSDILTVAKVFDGNDGEVGSAGASASHVFLDNENITFHANAQGQISATSFVVNVVAYTGVDQVLPNITNVTGLPEGMTYTKTDNTSSMLSTLTFNIDDNSTFGSISSTNGTASIFIASPIATTLQLNWSKINSGASGESGDSAVVFQIYSDRGYVLSKETPNVTLKTFAYIGSTPITAGALYQWYTINNDIQTAIEGATSQELEVSNSDVLNRTTYMCKMLFNEVEYIGVVTVEDKTDTNTVFTSKPNSYLAGDIWIIGEDYQPPDINIGVVLKAQHSNTNYEDGDWVSATKYDDDIDDIKESLKKYNQYFSFNTQDGLKMSAIDSNGNESKFSATLSNTQLSFNEGEESVAYISGNKMHIKEAEILSPLSVVGELNGQAPTINLGVFSLIVENNGSFSIVSNL